MKKLLLLTVLAFNFVGYAGEPMACTRDINEWGHPTWCQCEKDYVWNQVEGICEPLFCTMDINRWGNPSMCNCGRGNNYDPMEGKCHPKRKPYFL